MSRRPVKVVAVVLLTAILAALIPVRAEALPGSGAVSNFVSGGMSYAFEQTTHGMVMWVLESVGHFVNGVVNFLKTSGRPHPEAIWFSGPNAPYASVRSIALMMLLVFAFLGIISGLVSGDVEGMVRRIAGTLPGALFGMVAMTTVVAKMLDLTDAMSTAVLEHSGANALDFLSSFATASTLTNTSAFAALLLGFVTVVTAFLLWLELLVRSALVYFLVALSPMAFAAMLWPGARSVVRKLVELLLGVILSKFVICVALSIGAAALGGVDQAAPPDTGFGTETAMEMGSLLSGTALLAIACWSPFLLFRMLPVIEAAVVAHGVSRAPVSAARTALSTASSANSVTRLAGGGAATTRETSNSSSTRLSGGAAPSYVRRPQEHAK